MKAYDLSIGKSSAQIQKHGIQDKLSPYPRIQRVWLRKNKKLQVNLQVSYLEISSECFYWKISKVSG